MNRRVFLASLLLARHASWGAPGLDLVRGRSGFEYLAVRADLAHYRLRVLVGKHPWRADAMRRQTGAAVTVNGPFFDMNRDAMGLVVADGKLVVPMPPPSAANDSVLAVRYGRPVIMRRSEYSAAGVSQAVQCAPRLVVDGQPTTGLLDGDVEAPRMVIGLTERALLFICTASWEVASLPAMQKLLVSLGARQGMALDGGGSVQLSMAEAEVVARDPVPVGLGLFARNAS